MKYEHISVMPDEVINGLNIKDFGIYFDGTGGGGGHSERIVKNLKKGKLIVVDRDEDAIKQITKRLHNYNNVEIMQSNFRNIKEILKSVGIKGVDGVLLDLGVSSYHLDNPDRGFSYRYNGPLDMRMSKKGISAYQIVNNLVVEELSKILYDFGEDKFAFNIANNIVKYRKIKKIETTIELVEIIKKSIPNKYKKEKHPAKRTFQAIRIAVNNEIDDLRIGLKNSFESLNKNGRLLVITFHSIEDRIVKNFFAECAKGCICPSDFPICVCDNKPKGKIITKKPILPSDREKDLNKRSRSSKLRIIEKI